MERFSELARVAHLGLFQGPCTIFSSKKSLYFNEYRDSTDRSERFAQLTSFFSKLYHFRTIQPSKLAKKAV
jgi:hypothetical protein